MKIDIQTIQTLKDSSKDLKVLYVEDNEEARRSTYDTLKEFFEDITTANDGVEGLEKFYENKYDLVIADINMPRLNGIDMVSKIRQSDANVAILIISAYGDSGYFIETIRLGVEGYLLKPIELEQFLTMLSKTVEKIKIKKQLALYQKSLEDKVQEQLLHIKKQNDILKEREKFAVMGEMIDAIAHQFKQPLNVMRLRSDEINLLLQRGITDISQSLESINKQIEFSSKTIDEFKNFFRNSSTIETIYISEIFDEVLKLTYEEIIKNKIEIINNIDKDLKIDINPSEFKHVLLNLILNAKDALVDRNIEKKKIVLEAYKQNGEIVICIEDNAKGIEENIIDKIFEPNFTTKDLSKGTGIGLHISKMILEKANASIEVSNTQEGARFCIKIKSN